MSNCISEDFAEYFNFGKHNSYWFFNSPEVIRAVASENSISLEGSSLFYYKAYELEFDDKNWKAYKPEPSFKTAVVVPPRKQLEGFDVVSFWSGTYAEHSPLSCNSLAKDVRTNSHCLFASFEEPETSLNNGTLKDCEPGHTESLRSIPLTGLSWLTRQNPGARQALYVFSNH